MFHVLADSLISILKIAKEGISVFSKKCIATIEPDLERCRTNLESSTAFATLLVSRLGYDMVSDIVKEAMHDKKSLRDIIYKREILSELELDKILLEWAS